MAMPGRDQHWQESIPHVQQVHDADSQHCVSMQLVVHSV
jgi:hypothetical protein